jgi:hypothetical protein
MYLKLALERILDIKHQETELQGLLFSRFKQNVWNILCLKINLGAHYHSYREIANQIIQAGGQCRGSHVAEIRREKKGVSRQDLRQKVQTFFSSNLGNLLLYQRHLIPCCL